MGRFRVLGSETMDDWRGIWRRLPLRLQDPYTRPEFYSASRAEGQFAECAVYEDDDAIIVYPYLRNPIHTISWLALDRECYDIAGAYGYGGPVGTTADPAIWTRFWKEFGAYCNDHAVVAEFIRLHPLLVDRTLLDGGHQVELANLNVVVDLKRAEEAIWASYRHNVRKNVAKALRSGVTVEMEGAPPRDFEAFLDTYHGTLGRRGATDAYRFPRHYYDVLHQTMPESVAYFFARHHGEIVSSELCLLSESIVYSFLGGTRQAAFEVRPNNLLKHELILWARRRGMKQYLIGGGSAMGDGIFDYKRGFAPAGIVEFYIAKRAHDAVLYAELVARCARRFGPPAAHVMPWFLRWRQEPPSEE